MNEHENAILAVITPITLRRLKRRIRAAYLAPLLVFSFTGVAKADTSLSSGVVSPIANVISLELSNPNPGISDSSPNVAQMPAGSTPGNVHVDGGPAPFGIPAQFAVNQNTGAATYSVPIDVPPGVTGMEPKLSFKYNSMSGNGQLGVGWSIGGLDAIVRCPQTTATNDVAGGVNDDANDRYCLDGQQLIAVAAQGKTAVGAYGADKTNYAKEIDDISEIISHGSGDSVGSPSYFDVYTKSGLILEYGNTTTSPHSTLLSTSSSVVEAWELDKVSDHASNYMTILYNSDPSNGVLYPDRIYYTGNYAANVAGTHTIVFNWQSRSDVPPLYAAGSLHKTFDRLQSVQTYSGSTLVSDYELAYQNGGSTLRSEITSITKYDGSSPQNSLPSLTFTWSDAEIDTQPDLITKITNGFGASTSITYLPETSPAAVSLGGSFAYPQALTVPSTSVVREVTHTVPLTSFTSSTALGNTTTSYSTTYSYIGPNINLQGRGYSGFLLNNTEDVQTGLIVSSDFWQSFPLIGNIAYQEETTVPQFIAGGAIYVKDIVYDYELSLSAQGRVVPQLSESIENRNDIEPGTGDTFGSPVLTSSPAFPKITHVYSYDSSGPGNTTWDNMTQDAELTGDGYAKYTNNVYFSADPSTWLTGLVSGVYLTVQGIGQSTSQSQTRSMSYADNSLGQVTSETVDPGLGTNIASATAYTYDDFGNVTSVTVSGADVPTATKSVTYDSNGQFPTTITNALGQIEHVTTDARFGLISGLDDINNQTTNYTYDTFGRLTKKTNPDGTNENLTYSTCVPSGCVQSAKIEDEQFASDNSTQVTPIKWTNYDALGRSIYVDTQAFSGTTSRVATLYGSSGNLHQQTSPYFVGSVPVITTNTYDELGRIIETTHPDGSVDQTNFNGQTVTKTDGLSQTATTFTDGHGNVSWTQDSLGNKITFTYDGFDQRTSVTDAAGNVTSYNFDIRGRAVSGVDPDKGVWYAAYNSLGELAGTTDADEAVAGTTTNMTYDLLGRMTERVEPDMTSNWSYDPTNGIGEMAAETASGAASPSGSSAVGYTKTYSYDGLGRLSGTTVTEALPWSPTTNGSYTETFSYDNAGRPSGFTTPWDSILTEYNNYGYELSQERGDTGTIVWQVGSRDAAGSLTSATFSSINQQNAISQNFTYDPNTERVTAISATSVSNATLQSINYAYDVLGNVTARTINATSSESTPLTEYYSYDGLNRLCSTNSISASLATTVTATQSCTSQPQNFYQNGGVAPSIGLTYNNLGSLTAKSDVGSYTYPASYTGSGTVTHPHAVQSISGGIGSFTYDANGNMLSGNGRTNAYTSFNMPKTITLNGQTNSFSYNPEHQLAEKVNPSIDTLYFPHWEVTSANAGVNRQASTYFEDTNGQDVALLYRSALTATSTGTVNVEFLLNDWQNSVSVIANSIGGVIEADSYDAWGKRRNLNGSSDTNDTITSQSIHGYTNQEQITDIQLIDLNARMYDPYLGTMLSVDPAVANWLDQQTWNAYSYARDNPLRYTDPTGMSEHSTGGDPDAFPGCDGVANCYSYGTPGGIFEIQPVQVNYNKPSSSPNSSDSMYNALSPGTGPYTDPNLDNLGSSLIGSDLDQDLTHDIIHGFFSSFLVGSMIAAPELGVEEGIADLGAAEGTGEATVSLFRAMGQDETESFISEGGYSSGPSSGGKYFAFNLDGPESAMNFATSPFNINLGEMSMSQVNVPESFLENGFRFNDPGGAGASIHFGDEFLSQLNQFGPRIIGQ